MGGLREKPSKALPCTGWEHTLSTVRAPRAGARSPCLAEQSPGAKAQTVQ